MLAQFLLVRATLVIDAAHAHAMPLWPPAGVMLGGLLLVIRRGVARLAAWRFVSAMFTGSLLAEAAMLLAPASGPAVPVAWIVALSTALGNASEVVLVAWSLRRLGRGDPVASTVDVLAFSGTCLVAATAGATLGVASLVTYSLLPAAAAGRVWVTWWLADVSGMLVVAPALFALGTTRLRDLLPARWTRPALTAAGVGLAIALVHATGRDGAHHDRLLAPLLVLAIALAAYRHGRPGAAWSVLAVAASSVAAMLQGQGPFAPVLVPGAMVSLDTFLVLCALTGWFVAATLSPGASGPAGAGASGRVAPAATLAGGIAVTVLAWHAVSADTERQAAQRFQALGTDIRGRIAERMQNFELALRGARGLHVGSELVTDVDWQHYVGTLDLRVALPGVQALGYAERRTGGPAGPGAQAEGRDATPVRMIAPLDAANARVLGFDLSSEGRRREAIDRARDSGLTSITAPILLVQDRGVVEQPGFLMVLPLYVNGSDPGTVEARRLRTLGYVYAPFRIRTMMDDLLRPADRALLDLDIRDAGDADAGPSAPPLYASDAGGPGVATRAHYRHQAAWTGRLDFGGRTWLLDFHSRPAFEATVDHQKPLLVLLAGGLVSLLMFSVMRALAEVKEDALALAERMTREREQAEVRFRSLAGSAGDGIAVWSDDGLLSYSNDAFARLLGRPAEEVTGRSILDLLPVPGIRTPEDWHVFMTAGDLTTTEHHLSRADGTTVPVEVSLGRWTLHGATNHVGIVRDVTARHLADALLRETQDDLNAVLDHLPAMVSSCTPDLRLRFFNREHADWYGVDEATPPGLHMRQLVGEANFRELEPLMRRALAGERVSVERRIVTHDGRERWAQIHYFPDHRHGRVEGMIRLVFDITPLKAAQDELQANLRLHDLIFNHAGIGLAMLRDGVFERASHHLTELFGCEDGGLDGRPVEDIFPDEASYVTLRDEARLEFMCGRTFDRETSLRHRDGTPIWCRLLARAVDPDDASAGTILIIQDFRDRRQREQLLDKARVAAESASRLKAEFLANMSHEIRTPMNGIIGMTRLTLESALTEAQRENLEIVLDSAGSLMHLLNDILDFSKVEAGKLELERAEFDLRERLWATAVPFATLARGKGLELVLDVAPDVPGRVTGDSVRLMQVVSNLLSNAVKFTVSGSVTCRVDARPEEDGGCRLEIAVIDTGPGMTREVQSRIFGSFVQADASVTRQHGGSGLGLAICSQIVVLMDGAIRVESASGEGATFRFDARFAHASPPPEVPAPVREHLQGQSVLVVSPLAPLRQALARQLAAAGARAVEFPSAAPAVAAAELARRVGAPFAGAIVDDGPHDPALARLPHLVRLRAADRPLGSHDDTGLRKPPRPADLLAALCSGVAAPPGTAAGAPMAPVPAPARAARPLAVLLAEDHPVNQKLAQRLLERRGHRVTWARHGEEAVRLSAEADFDVILMDIQMPVMDGVTAMRAIRAREAPAGRRTPIVALTAHALQGERERLLAQGMDEHLSKPLDPAALLRVVESFGARSDARPPAPAPAGTSSAEALPLPPAVALRDEPRPLLDLEAALEGTQGDAGLLGELAALLLQELPCSRQALRDHVQACDWEAAARASHRLKGAAGNVQALGTQALSVRLETACAACDEAAAGQALDALEHELDRLAEALSALATEKTT